VDVIGKASRLFVEAAYGRCPLERAESLHPHRDGIRGVEALYRIPVTAVERFVEKARQPNQVGRRGLLGHLLRRWDAPAGTAHPIGRLQVVAIPTQPIEPAELRAVGDREWDGRDVPGRD
jgi:hypothetical protein